MTFTPSGDSTTVRLTYHDIDNENQAQQLESHWQAGLENLESFFDTGIDLRIARRPMLGVWLGDLVNEETAERHGTERGIILAGVLPDMSAEAAGLQSDDVLVEVAGRTLNDYGDLNNVILRKLVGESVKVVYMRDGERRNTEMTLKSRPIPDIPFDPDALADRMVATYAEVDAEFDALVAEMTEEQADTLPGNDEWSTAPDSRASDRQRARHAHPDQHAGRGLRRGVQLLQQLADTHRADHRSLPHHRRTSGGIQTLRGADRRGNPQPAGRLCAATRQLFQTRLGVNRGSGNTSAQSYGANQGRAGRIMRSNGMRS